MNQEDRQTTQAEIINNLRTLYDYESSDNPVESKKEFLRLKAIPIRTILNTLNSEVTDEKEYERLLHIAVEQLSSESFAQHIELTKEEFVYKRQKYGLTQQWVSDKAQVSIATVRRWENPVTNYMPSHKAWEELGKFGQWEYDLAKSRLTKLLSTQDEFLNDFVHERWDGIEEYAPENPDPILIRLRYCLTEEQRKKLVKEAAPITEWVNPESPHYDENYDIWYQRADGLDRCESELHHSLFQAREGLWCIVDEPNVTVDIQNAIVRRIVEIVQKKDFDDTVTIRPVKITFSPDKNVTQVLQIEQDLSHLPD